MLCGWLGGICGFCLVVAAAEPIVEVLVGSVDGGCSVVFVAIDSGASPFSPELEASGVLRVCGKQRDKDVAVCSEHERGFGAQRGDGHEESRVADGVICCLGVSVVIGLATVPLGLHGEPEKRDESPDPDRAGPAAPDSDLAGQDEGDQL